MIENDWPIPHATSVEEYENALEFELDIIEGDGSRRFPKLLRISLNGQRSMTFPWAQPWFGCGFVGGYALTITDLDPLRYSLLFERFLNPERVSMPDFEGLCMDRREEVIHVQEKYGRDKVAQIITFGALLSKAAVRDIGRVLQMPYGQVDRLSKIPLRCQTR